MLKLMITGNIGSDAVIHDGGNGRSAIGFSVATVRKVKEEKVTTWVKCTKWVASGGSTAIADYLKKGVKVLVIGEAGCEVYQEKANLTLNVTEIELMGGDKSTPVEPAPTPAPETPVDLPF